VIVRSRGLAVEVPTGWDVRIGSTSLDEIGATRPLVHGANFGLPERRSEYGSGVVERMSTNNTFVSLVEFGAESVGTALFSGRGLPRRLDPESFHPNQLQRPLPGQAGLQLFFIEADRAFCLYVVLGRHANRARLVPTVDQLLSGITILPPGAP